jgi:hypothetical protein
MVRPKVSDQNVAMVFILINAKEASDRFSLLSSFDFAWCGFLVRREPGLLGSKVTQFVISL